MVSASDTPTVADLPWASPSAVVLADAVWSALALNEPLMLRSLTGATVASVVMFERAMATLGTTATLPPPAPVLACVVMWCVVLAAIVRLRPPVSVPVSSAVVVSSTSATATDAPIPTEPTPLTPDSFGNALVDVVESEAAVIATSPVLASSAPATDAVVAMFSISIARDPAMPTFPPPDPLVALAPSSCTEFMSASIVAPFASTVAPAGSVASFWIRT
jgi:hypothetical protein